MSAHAEDLCIPGCIINKLNYGVSHQLPATSGHIKSKQHSFTLTWIPINSTGCRGGPSPCCLRGSSEWRSHQRRSSRPQCNAPASLVSAAPLSVSHHHDATLQELQTHAYTQDRHRQWDLWWAHRQDHPIVLRKVWYVVSHLSKIPVEDHKCIICKSYDM